MRIDSSGNLLVGHTSQDTPVDNGGAGVTLRPQGVMLIGGTGTSIYANREDSDGEIVQFRKDGSAVGSIGTYNSANYIQSGSAGSYTGIYFNTNKIEPVGDASGDIRADATVDIGSTANRFKDLYLSGTAFLSGTSSISGNTSSASSLGITSGHASSPMVFYIGEYGNTANERMRIDSSGKVGIGTATPNALRSIR